LAIRKQPELSEAKREKERLRYTFAPLVIAVVARLDAASKVPEIEQRLCAGNVAYNLLLGAYALGYGAQWLTGWGAYDPDVAAILGLAANEHVVAFVHLGTPQIEVPDRERPALDDLLSTWSPCTRNVATPRTWSMAACTCSAPGTRCRTSSTTPTATWPTRCTATPASCVSCWRRCARNASRWPSTPRSPARSATRSTRPTRPTANCRRPTSNASSCCAAK